MDKSRQRSDEDDTPHFRPGPFHCDDEEEYDKFPNNFHSGKKDGNEKESNLFPMNINFHSPETGENELADGHVYFPSSPPPAKISHVADKCDYVPQTPRASRKETNSPHERSFLQGEMARKEEPKQWPVQQDCRPITGGPSSELPAGLHGMTEQEPVDKEPKLLKPYRDLFNDWLDENYHGLAEHFDELQELRDVNAELLEAFVTKARQLNEIYQLMKNEKKQIFQTLDEIRATFALRDSPSNQPDP